VFDRLLDSLIDRIRFIFSIEFIFTTAIVYLINKTPVLKNWLSPKYIPNFSDGVNTVVQQYSWYNNMEYLRFLVVFVLVLIVVYGIGEIVRRKLKFKSLLFSNKKNIK